MLELSELVNERYKKYVASQVGRDNAKYALDFSAFGYVAKACGVARDFHKYYEVGVALATEGLYLGYIAKCFGFPVLNVKLGRRFNGAIWKPIDTIDEEAIKDKRVIVFDNDVVTGRTLKRAEREINRLSPKYVDLLLVYAHTELTPANYVKWKKYFSRDVKILGRDKFGDLSLDTMCMIPEGFRKVESLEKDFEPDYEVLQEFEKKLRGGK